MIDFYKFTTGDVVECHLCDRCARKSGLVQKDKADSSVSSWLCNVCGHYGIGSMASCLIGDWLILIPIAYTKATS